MIARSLVALLFLWIQTGTALMAQDGSLVRISGRVFADNHPVSWTVEVRLERQDGSLVTTGYTGGSYEFTINTDAMEPSERHYLVVREPGYKELRFLLDIDNFHRDIFSEAYSYSGMATLDLESLPGQGRLTEEQLKGSKVIDVRQLHTKISDEALAEFDLAIADFDKGDDEAARMRLEKVVEMAPEYYDAVARLGGEYLKVGRFEEAEGMLRRARDLNSKDPVTMVNLGTLYFQQGEMLASADADAGSGRAEASYRKAAEMFEEALLLDPRAPRTSLHMGTALFRAGDFERAESMLMNALALDLAMHDARLTLINIYIQQQRYKEALEQISAYLGANPDSPQREHLEDSMLELEMALEDP